MLHFNDGAPYTDWDTNNGFTVPADFVSLDPDAKYGENEALDDVALMFRNHDLRADLVGPSGNHFLLCAGGTGRRPGRHWEPPRATA